MWMCQSSTETNTPLRDTTHETPAPTPPATATDHQQTQMHVQTQEQQAVSAKDVCNWEMQENHCCNEPARRQSCATALHSAYDHRKRQTEDRIRPPQKRRPFREPFSQAVKCTTESPLQGEPERTSKSSRWIAPAGHRQGATKQRSGVLVLKTHLWDFIVAKCSTTSCPATWKHQINTGMGDLRFLPMFLPFPPPLCRNFSSCAENGSSTGAVEHIRTWRTPATAS